MYNFVISALYIAIIIVSMCATSALIAVLIYLYKVTSRFFEILKVIKYYSFENSKKLKNMSQEIANIRIKAENLNNEENTVIDYDKEIKRNANIRKVIK